MDAYLQGDQLWISMNAHAKFGEDIQAFIYKSLHFIFKDYVVELSLNIQSYYICIWDGRNYVAQKA